MISVIIPISYKDWDAGLMAKLSNSLNKAIEYCLEDVEVIPVLNPPWIGRINAKNNGAKQANGDVLVFLDVDCSVSENFLNEVNYKSINKYFVGGGTKYVKLTRYSLGIICGLVPLALYMLFKQITLGAFWVRKSYFFEIGGFGHTKYDDIDFAIRLRKLAKKYGLKFESLKKSHIIWSTRKFDEYGDWHWITGYQTK